MALKSFKKPSLSLLADLLIKELKDSVDFFIGPIVVVPNHKIENWFKAYWLKTQKDILMNIDYQVIDSALFSFFNDSDEYSLLNKQTLKLLILKELVASNGNNLPEEITKYIKKETSFNSVNLYDLVNEFADAFIEFENGNVSSIKQEYLDFYHQILDKAKTQYHLTSISSLLDSSFKTNNRKTYFFGFTSFTDQEKALIEKYSHDHDVLIYEVEETTDVSSVTVNITTAPSKLREVEAIHTRISTLLKDNKDLSYSDFLVVSPNIKEYETTIKRVFKQDNDEFFDMPFSINSDEAIDTDVTLLLNKLIEIYHKGFYTRNDFYQIINNEMVSSIRNISDEEKEAWINMIIIANVYRQRERVDDWDYIRKRILLSKLLNVNDVDNTISLDNKEYRPYSYVGVDDETIIKFVQIIDDLNSWIKTINLIAESNVIDVNNIELIKQELDKWCSIFTDEVETNRLYKPICRVIKDIKDYGVLDHKIPLMTFLYLLLDVSKASKNSRGKILTNGVTFTNFSKDYVLNANYVFFLGASSSNLPSKYLESEIYTIKNKPDVIQRKHFFMQYHNAIKEFNISYIDKDLKTEEDFYPSTFVKELITLIGEGNYHINKIPLDETRIWQELFTRREFKDKVYRKGLFESSDDTSIETKEDIDVNLKPIDKLTLNDIKAYLDEPLMFLSNRLFADENNNYEDIINEYEPFDFNKLEEYKIVKKFITIGLEKTIEDEDIDKVKDELSLNNGLYGLSDEESNIALKGLKKEAQATIDLINEVVGIKENKKLDTLELIDGASKWKLDCNNSLMRIIDEDTRRYIELKKLPDKDKDYLYPYTYSLMDIASLKDESEEEKIYHVILGDGANQFDLTPNEAIEILNEIHRRINNIKDTKCIPFDLEKRDVEKIETPFDLFSKITEQHAKWDYFDHKKSFNENKIGYDENDFDFKTSLFEHRQLIKYLVVTPVIEEEEAKDETI